MTSSNSIISAIRQKLSAIHNTTGSPYKGTLFLGREQWEQFEKYAREEWLVHVKSHQNNWIAGTLVKLETKVRDGIYTKEELEAVFALRKAASPTCIDSANKE